MHNSPTWDEKVGNEEEDSNPFFEHRGGDEGLLCHRHGLRSRPSRRMREKQLLVRACGSVGMWELEVGVGFLSNFISI